MLVHSWQNAGSTNYIRSVLKSSSWDPKTWNPWEELKNKEEENRVKMIKENPEAPPFHTEKGKFHDSTSSWRPKE